LKHYTAAAVMYGRNSSLLGGIQSLLVPSLASAICLLRWEAGRAQPSRAHAHLSHTQAPQAGLSSSNAGGNTTFNTPDIHL